MSMSKVITESRPLPDITSDDISERSISGHQYAGKSSFLPPSYRLIVTTSRGVYAWDMDGVTELFRSGSEGIVAAKKLSGHGEILAVADSQVVILHDIKKGMQRSYRLKGSEVRPAIGPLSKHSLKKTGPSALVEVRWKLFTESVFYNVLAQLGSIVLFETFEGFESVRQPSISTIGLRPFMYGTCSFVYLSISANNIPSKSGTQYVTNFATPSLLVVGGRCCEFSSRGCEYFSTGFCRWFGCSL